MTNVPLASCQTFYNPRENIVEVSMGQKKKIHKYQKQIQCLSENFPKYFK